MNPAPIFTGKNPSIMAVESFIVNFKMHIIEACIPLADRSEYLDSLIQPPAKAEYDLALADDEQMHFPAPLAVDPNDAAVVADQLERLNIRITWL